LPGGIVQESSGVRKRVRELHEESVQLGNAAPGERHGHITSPLPLLIPESGVCSHDGAEGRSRRYFVADRWAMRSANVDGGPQSSRRPSAACEVALDP
jgi:hypothetical protein